MPRKSTAIPLTPMAHELGWGVTIRVKNATYCASPAAGKGESLAMIGGGALADVLEKNNGDYKAAFDAYNQGLRLFVEEVQAEAKENVTKYLVPRRQEAIRERKEGRFLE